MASLEEVNDRARHAIDFRIESFDGSKLLMLGSFDFCYYHEIELTFSEVTFIRCPVTFSWPIFSNFGCAPDGVRFLIQADEGQFEIIAEAFEATIGMVYYYDRGDKVRPGERIADWVQRPGR